MIQQQETQLMENDLVWFHAFPINGQTFRHRATFFAFEDRKQIASLIVETYERLAAVATIVSGKIVTAANLWEQTDAFMNDAASKTLKNLLKDLFASITSHITNSL